MRAGDDLVVLGRAGQPQGAGNGGLAEAVSCSGRDAGSTDRRNAIARGDPRGSAMPGVQAFTAAAGRPPGLGIVLVGENPASEVYVRNKVKAGDRRRAVGRSAAPAGDRVARRAARAGRSAERQRSPRRHPGPVAAAGGDGEAGVAARVRRDRSRQGRGRLSSRQRRQAGAGARAPEAVHAVGGDRDARSLRDRDRRPARRRDRPQRDRRQADGDAAAAARRDRDGLPFEDAGPGVGRRGAATSSSPRSAARRS